ncbi:SigE family RNA polymerase sigma factor [Nocardioides sp. MH1]|uniref:SigE family RNA polymerase sigma factor n=1 Tax=Nocardioides sp. MH1 TaxID=3242490 RepID=UPI00351FD844
MIETVPHDAFEEFARARAPHLYRAAWLLSGQRAEAEDLVQETLAKVYVRMHRRLAPPLDNPAAYAQVTLTRTYISARRRRSSAEVPYGDLPDVVTSDTADQAIARVDLEEALAALSPTDRAVVVLRYLDDVAVDEVARTLRLSPGAVKNRSMRALARMRERTTR